MLCLLERFPLFILIISISLFLFQIRNSGNDLSVSYEDPNEIVEPVKIEINNAEESECKAWLGSENFSECILGTEIVNIEDILKVLIILLFIKATDIS